MPKFSKASKEKLSQCHNDLQTLFNKVGERYDCSIIEGHRGKENQNLFFLLKKSKVQWPDGKHNKTPSEATDAIPYPVDWDDKKRFYHFMGYVKGVADMLFEQGKMSRRIRCGGDWDGDNTFTDQTLHDLPHFELI